MDPAVLEWCKRLIRCRSVTTEGTRRVAELCAAELLAPCGIEARLIPSRREGDAQVNLLATIRGSDPAAAPLVLNTHLDTVPPGDIGLWTQCDNDPFAATVAGDRIYGLGTADTKLDFLAKAMAVAQCRRPRRDLYLVGTFGEEHGLVGAKEMIEAGVLPRGALAFVGEPSHLEVVTAHKGLAVFEIGVMFEPLRTDGQLSLSRQSFAGLAAHSSTPALGRNAICAALEAIAGRPEVKVAALSGGDAVNKVPARCEVLVSADSAPALAGAVNSEDAGCTTREFIPNDAIAVLARFAEALRHFADHAGPADPDYAAPTLTCNPGVIRSSPGIVTLEFELRPPPGLPLEAVEAGLRKLIAALSRTARVELRLSKKRANPGFRSPDGSEALELAMRALAGAGLALQTGVKVGCTEAGIYAAAGLKPVVFGPGPSTGVIHAPNEYNLLSEVEAAIGFYSELLGL